ncbi:insulinase family protein [Balneatrix alpica]|uniref:Protease 3 n=1 Tax=Balneatrix alpica TaxID=75684 RepID=A0ABV5ZEH9_9GAMM|nr:insulinase family protein [Balneatrix alpica]
MHTLARFAVTLLWLLSLNALAAPIKQSPNDNRSYHNLTLANGLQVLLISDPATDKSAAAVDVSVGSADEPDALPGLAHFLEHMLFLGTDRYPQAGEYQSFISRNGGNHNAYTAFTHTNYFFDIDPPQLYPALQRFARFFIAPTLDPTYIEREVKAVDSEYKAKIREDGRRLYETQRLTYNPAHPASRFSVGSLDTLKDQPQLSLQQALQDFYQQHYRSERMRLVILGREPLEQLSQWASELFAEVPQQQQPYNRSLPPLYLQQQLPQFLQLRPLKQTRNLIISFPLPSQLKQEANKPLQYIAALLGDEGPGSLLEVFKQQGWATSLSAGAGYYEEDASTLQLSLELTPAGVQAQPQLLGLIFAYIDLIKREGVEAWRYQQYQQLAEIDFRFQERTPPMHWVSYLARKLHDTEAEDILYRPYQFAGFQAAEIHALLQQLRPEQASVLLMAPEAITEQQSEWYQVDYQLQHKAQLDISTETALNSQLALPAANPYIPNDFTLVTGSSDEKPRLLQQQPGFQLWHASQTRFGAPKADLYLSLRSPIANASPRHTLLTELMIRSIKDHLNDQIYPALEAGQEVNFYRHLRGATLKISGYHDKQPLLLGTLLSQMTTQPRDARRFLRIKKGLQEDLLNAYQQAPYQRALGSLSSQLLPNNWDEGQLLAVLAELNLSDLHDFIPQWWQALDVLMLSHGNLTAEQAQSLAGQVQQHLLNRSQAVTVPRAQLRQLSPGHDELIVQYSPHADLGVSWYWQGQDDSIESQARLALLAQLLEAPFYTEIRTEQQLGYIAFASAFPLLDHPGLSFTLQSPNASPEQVNQAFRGFLQQFQQQLQRLRAEDLRPYQQALISTLLTPATQLGELSEEYWRELDRQAYDFSSREKLAEAIAKLTPAELRHTLAQLLAANQQRLIRVEVRPQS